jgi:hypothetical protein
VLLPVMVVLDEIREIAFIQEILLSLNLLWFLAYQIVFNRFIIAAVRVILHWGDQWLSHNFHMSSIQVNWIVWFKLPASQDHNLIANSHSKKIWKEDSTWLLQRLHIEGIWQPLHNRFSSVGTFSCIILQTKSDFEGGMSVLQIRFAQERSWNCCILKRYASLSCKSPLSECFHKSLSTEKVKGMVIWETMGMRFGNARASCGGIHQEPL